MNLIRVMTCPSWSWPVCVAITLHTRCRARIRCKLKGDLVSHTLPRLLCFSSCNWCTGLGRFCSLDHRTDHGHIKETEVCAQTLRIISLVDLEVKHRADFLSECEWKMPLNNCYIALLFVYYDIYIIYIVHSVFQCDFQCHPKKKLWLCENKILI